MFVILYYQSPNFSKYLRNPYIYHVYFVCNFKCRYPFIYFFKFIRRRTTDCIYKWNRINVNNNNNNNNNNKNAYFVHQRVFRAWPNINNEAKCI